MVRPRQIICQITDRSLNFLMQYLGCRWSPTLAAVTLREGGEGEQSARLGKLFTLFTHKLARK